MVGGVFGIGWEVSDVQSFQEAVVQVVQEYVALWQLVAANGLMVLVLVFFVRLCLVLRPPLVLREGRVFAPLELQG